ncbi:polysaccharide biosynthesis/export family protein [Thalassomonas sp. M1454]|uniref:polysaccharide biosynthesis/export family protein n=1 Tax=Thalassomonas sp. M1454 TaxID=2594477 RepID=UPI0011806D1C|nr:polysaccharide biosynthesis/export family protein [Thalassomonas sp. M1454]TRX57414.1 polysaccharide export protein [Thalassomonas sp. M1454]
MIKIFKLVFISLTFTYLLPAHAALPDSAKIDAANQAMAGGLTSTSGLTPNQALTQLDAGQAAGLTGGSQGSYTDMARYNTLLPGEQSIEKLLPIVEYGLPAPYGANIFAGGYESERIDGLNDDYLIAPGDKISIWLWGAVNYADVSTVDNQGNIFIPDIGPVKVENVPASKINQLVTTKLRSIYKQNVQIYVNLLTATPVSVYISGPVIRPGQYAGMASDSILYFLKRAGGIDAERGSYRKIDIIRSGEVIESIDLYDFVRHGIMPKVNFKDKDVILVQPQGATVVVTAGAKNPFRFEFSKGHALGDELTSYARPLTKISHVGIIGNRDNGPFSIYLPLNKFSSYLLKDGDKIFFNDDWDAQVLDVKLEGSFIGPSYFTTRKPTTLYDLLNHVQIDPQQADFNSIYILRESVAEKQKEMLDRALDRLERSVYTNSPSSTGEAGIQVQEASLVSAFVKRAKEVETLGKVVVSENGVVANISLEEGDTIVIPEKTDLVHIGGEVFLPQSIVYNPKAKITDYIAWSGGYTERANYERLLIIHANGLISFYEADSDSWMAQSENAPVIKPGDQVLVLPKVVAKTMQTVKDLSQILYQIAITADVVLN